MPEDVHGHLPRERLDVAMIQPCSRDGEPSGSRGAKAWTQSPPQLHGVEEPMRWVNRSVTSGVARAKVDREAEFARAIHVERSMSSR